MFNIKVLQIISGNDAGGGGNHVLNLSFYSKNMFECIIGAIGEGIVIDKAKELGIETVSFTSKSIYNGSLLTYIKENNIDIINFHGAKAFFMHYFLKNKLEIPSVATIHSNYKKDFLNNKFKHLLFTPLSIRGIRSFSNYICVSKYIKNLLENDRVKGKKFLVNNGIEYSSVKITIDKDEIREKYSIDANDFVFVNVARMHPIKNHSALIEAFAKLRKETKGIKLLLIGDGELEYQLKDKVRDLVLDKDIIFTGFVNNTIDFVNASDISILTSFSEGGSPPLVILESAAVKKTFICSKVGDIDETINSDNGFLVNPYEVNDIYEKMKEAYSQREHLMIKGKNLYERVKEDYSMNEFCTKYHNAYKEILVRR
ncbi:glycosyltransferase [Clostridium sp. DJ247]|uniref:glycosyltransferase n=1 Tax=Clostridium sp. DJ247 TaxID=2726188 RepID=UPI00162AF7EE|nr:glycosyltransferase [Clostridium sp. DJ247]MBC2580239.1 glycosyltransferase [Clostridium sp. DJ247]